MDQPFDVLRKDKDGLVWRAATGSLDEAMAVVIKLSKSEIDAEFVILNQDTQEHITIKPALVPTKTNAA